MHTYFMLHLFPFQKQLSLYFHKTLFGLGKYLWSVKMQKEEKKPQKYHKI